MPVAKSWSPSCPRPSPLVSSEAPRVRLPFLIPRTMDTRSFLVWLFIVVSPCGQSPRTCIVFSLTPSLDHASIALIDLRTPWDDHCAIRRAMASPEDHGARSACDLTGDPEAPDARRCGLLRSRIGNGSTGLSSGSGPDRWPDASVETPPEATPAGAPIDLLGGQDVGPVPQHTTDDGAALSGVVGDGVARDQRDDRGDGVVGPRADEDRRGGPPFDPVGASRPGRGRRCRCPAACRRFPPSPSRRTTRGWRCRGRNSSGRNRRVVSTIGPTLGTTGRKSPVRWG